MIEFKTVKWKNLLSYGNNMTTFDFTTGVCKIQASNGMGKSSIIDAIYFALYGKPYRKIKIKQLINSKNKKGLEVHLKFKKQDDEYIISRTLKPDTFKIYKNNEIIPVSSNKRGYQQILDDDILGFNENLSNQVIFKSLTKSASFMTLDKAEKRSIIENLFDIELFTTISKNLKIKTDQTDQTIRDTKKDIDNINLLIEQELANLEKMKNLQTKLKLEADILISSYQEEIKELQDKNIKFKTGIEIINKKKIDKANLIKSRTDIQSKIDIIENKKIELEIAIGVHEEKILFLKNTCGSCPNIINLNNDENNNQNKVLLENYQVELDEYKLILKSILDSIDKANRIINNENFVNNGLIENTNRINKLQSQISIIREKVITIDESKFNEYNNRKIDLTDTYNKLCNKKEHLLVLRSLFSDDGMKPLIINKYLPSINRLLNTYLTKFNANTIFNFDSNFNEVINTRHKEDYSYHNFSEGEKKRIDLAILFTFIKFAMHKNKKSNTNLLIFDEVMSGLDATGTVSLFDILKEHTDYQNKCILTINHNNDLDSGYFDKTYNVIMEKGFSKILEIE
jgi:DNA repair exonuclease SbcCD ATPase subunit